MNVAHLSGMRVAQQRFINQLPRTEFEKLLLLFSEDGIETISHIGRSFKRNFRQ